MAITGTTIETMSPSTQQQLALAERHFRARQYEPAEELLLRIVAASPKVPKAWELLAYISGNRGELDACEERLLKATALPGCSAEALFYLGRVQLQNGRGREATISFERSIQLAGEYFEGLHELAVAHSAIGEHALALRALQRAEKKNPHSPELHANMANTLSELQRHEEALQHYDRALALNPRLARTWADRGFALSALGRESQALESYERALGLAPQDVYTWMNRAATLASLKRDAELGACIASLAGLPPETEYLRGYWLSTSMQGCRWAAWEPLVRETLARVDAGERAAVPLSIMATPASAATLLACARAYARHQFPSHRAQASYLPREAGRKLRVGYFSSDFRNHPVAQLIVRLFECHDRSRHEWFAFSIGHFARDEMSHRVAAAFDHFLDVSGKTDAQIATLAREAGIDIAVDLNGFTEGARPRIFAHGAAPVQVNYLGFPGTMGSDLMDYIVADATLIRPDEFGHYAEKVVLLPGSYQPNDSTKKIAGDAGTRESVGLPARGFVFACFNNNFKITPDAFGVWARLLAQVPGSVLWLLEGNGGARRGIEAEARALGLDPARLVWAPRMPLAEHLSRHRHADLFLDTFHYNAHTTASDALWAGLPVLTLAGRTFASRVAASLLKAVGLPELVTDSVEAYEALALSLARSPALLEALRARLRGNLSTARLFDTPAFARQIEAAYDAMWEQHRLGLAPRHIQVS